MNEFNAVFRRKNTDMVERIERRGQFEEGPYNRLRDSRSFRKAMGLMPRSSRTGRSRIQRKVAA